MKKKKYFLLRVIILILITAAFCSTDFVLRVGVFFFSPKSAVTMEYELAGKGETGEQLYRITKNTPIEEVTQGYLYTWAVKSFGPFHFGYYYGEC